MSHKILRYLVRFVDEQTVAKVLLSSNISILVKKVIRVYPPRDQLEHKDFIAWHGTQITQPNAILNIATSK